MKRKAASDISSFDYERKTLVREGVEYGLIVFYMKEIEPIHFNLEEIYKDLEFELPTEENPNMEVIVHFMYESRVYEKKLVVSLKKTEEEHATT